MQNLSPTIVIGLGTFGGRTVSHLRTLIYEEIGVAGLPFFRFVHISSHKDDENIKPQPANHVGQKDWENYNVFHSTINVDDMQTIKTLVEGTSPRAEKEPGWREWLDPDLIKVCDSAYISGAGNSRMIGRSCLWNNWSNNESIKTRIMNMVTEITAPDKQVETEQVLRDYINRKQGVASDTFSFSPSNTIRVYIVASLCGGTGSGMFIDLAFFLRKAIGGEKLVFGIFSIPDNNTAIDTQHSRMTANAMAALLELDYYMRDNTKFKTFFPGDQMETNTNDYPYDYVQLVSPSCKGSKFQIGTSSTADDNSIKAMTAMCSTSLFFEIFGGAGSDKAGIWINYPAKSDQWRNARKKGPGFIQFLSTFGASTAHYPKYRIAGAAACLQTQEKILQWLGISRTISSQPGKGWKKNDIPRDSSHMAEIASKWFKIIYKKALTGIASSGGKNFREEWQSTITKLKYNDYSSYQLKENLNNLTVPAAFTANGKYTSIIRGRIESFLITSFETLNNLVNSNIDSIFTGSKSEDFMVSTILELRDVITNVIINIDNAINKSPSLLDSSYDVTNKLAHHFSEMALAQDSLAAALLFQIKTIRNYYSNLIIDRFIRIMNNEYNRMEDACIAEVLPSLKEDVERGPLSKVDLLIDRLNSCVSYLDDRYEELSFIEEWNNLKFVSQSNKPKSSKTNLVHDITEAKDLFRQKTWPQVLHRIKEKTNQSINDILVDSMAKPSEIMDLILDQVSHEIMTELKTTHFDLVGTLIRRYEHELKTLAERSLPMLELAADYLDIFGSGNHPVLICGGRPDSLKKIKENFKSHGIHTFDKVSKMDTFLDHMLHFYQEEGGIALDELKTYEALKKQYDSYRITDEPINRILHTHKDASQFDISYLRRIENLKRESNGRPSIFRIATQFIPDLIFIEKPVGKGIVEYLFEWEEYGIFLDALYNKNDPDSLLWELSRSDNGDEKFIEKVKEEIEQLDESEMNDRFSKLRTEIIEEHGRGKKLEEFNNYFNKNFIKKEDFPWF